MKRYGDLYSQIISFKNILLASRQAQKGKRFRDNVLDFNYHLETELIRLQKQLTDKTYQPGAYRTFHQIISAEEAPRFIYGGKALANLFAVVPS